MTDQPRSLVADLTARLALMLALIAYALPVLTLFRANVDRLIERYQAAYVFQPYSYVLGGLALLAMLIWVSTARPGDAPTRARRLIVDRPLVALLLITLSALGCVTLWRVVTHRFFTDIDLFRASPFIAGVLILLAGFELLDAAALRQIMPRLNARLDPARSITRLPLPLIALAILAIIYTLALIQRGVWNAPINGDPSGDVYVGMRLLAGDRLYTQFVEFQPPLRYVVTWWWAWTAALTHIPPTTMGRVWSLVAAIATIIVVYGMGTALTRRRGAGVFASAVLVGLSSFVFVLLSGPNAKQTAALVVALAIWLAQRRRWFFAALVATIATAMWLPAGGFWAVVVLSGLLQTADPRPRVVIVHLLAGTAAVLASLSLILLIRGAFLPALNQTVGATWDFLRFNLTGASDTPGGSPALYFFSQVRKVIEHYSGDYFFLSLAALGLLLIVRSAGRRLFRTPAIAAPLLGGLFITAFSLIDFNGVPDAMMMLPFLAAWAGVPWASLLDWLSPEDSAARPLATAALTTLLVIGSVYYGLTQDMPQFGPQARFTLATQQAMTADLAAVLTPSDTVHAMDDLWYPILAGSGNPAPFGWYGDRTAAAWNRAGLSTADVGERIAATDPTVMMLGPGAADILPPDWLAANYVAMGAVKGQLIYIRSGRDDIQSAIAAWPYDTE